MLSLETKNGYLAETITTPYRRGETKSYDGKDSISLQTPSFEYWLNACSLPLSRGRQASSTPFWTVLSLLLFNIYGVHKNKLFKQ